MVRKASMIWAASSGSRSFTLVLLIVGTAPRMASPSSLVTCSGYRKRLSSWSSRMASATAAPRLARKPIRMSRTASFLAGCVGGTASLSTRTSGCALAAASLASS